MKKLSLLILFMVIALCTIAQSPQAFKYQAVVRDNIGEIVSNQLVGIQISIRDTTAGGTIIYQETFSDSTNQFGLVNLEIGNAYSDNTGINLQISQSVSGKGGKVYIKARNAQNNFSSNHWGGDVDIKAGIGNNNSGGFIPLSRPFNTAPWNYSGTESVASIPVISPIRLMASACGV